MEIIQDLGNNFFLVHIKETSRFTGREIDVNLVLKKSSEPKTYWNGENNVDVYYRTSECDSVRAITLRKYS